METAEAVNPELITRLVVNQCQPNTNLAKEVLDVLPEFGISLCETNIHQRTAFRQAAVVGGTVHDLDKSAALAIAEIDALTDEALELLGVKARAEA